MVTTQLSKGVIRILLMLALVGLGNCGLLDKGYLEEGETVNLRGSAQTTHTIRLPVSVRTVRVTRTFAVPVPVPFPVRRDVPVPVHVPKPIPVPISYPSPVIQQPEASNPFPLYTDPANPIFQDASNPVAQWQHPSLRAFGTPGSSITLKDGSMGFVVGASYGVSDNGGFEGKHPGAVFNDPVGLLSSSSSGSPSFSISKSIESSFDSIGMGNALQGDDKGRK